MCNVLEREREREELTEGEREREGIRRKHVQSGGNTLNKINNFIRWMCTLSLSLSGSPRQNIYTPTFQLIKAPIISFSLLHHLFSPSSYHQLFNKI